MDKIVAEVKAKLLELLVQFNSVWFGSVGFCDYLVLSYNKRVIKKHLNRFVSKTNHI